MQINRRETILVLSKLLGYVGVDDTCHGLRVGYIVWRLTEHLNLPEDQRVELMEAGLLHDIGVSSTIAHRLLIQQIDVPDAIQHCVNGEAVISSIPTFAHLAPLVRFHHEHWKHFDFEAVHPSIALYSNLIFLSDRFDILMAQENTTTSEEREKVLEQLVQLQDLVFSPKCIEVLLAEVEDEQFWETVADERMIVAALKNEVGCCDDRVIDYYELQEIALTFSHIVDAKSPFTQEHSINTAEVAELLGLKAGFPHEVTDKIKLAGLLHDIGKLRVPDEILEKPAPLDDEERKTIESHPENSWNILKQIGGMEEISEWVRMHHEKLNGTGYPNGLTADRISQEAQILAVADIFQALMQKRPYRPPMEVSEAFTILDRMVEQEEVSRDLVALIKQHQREFVSAASASV